MKRRCRETGACLDREKLRFVIIDKGLPFPIPKESLRKIQAG